jgi:hypothetical protein
MCTALVTACAFMSMAWRRDLDPVPHHVMHVGLVLI